MKRYSMYVAISELQIKTSIKYHFMSTRMTIIKKIDKKVLSLWRNPHTLLGYKVCSHFGKHFNG